MRLSPEFHTTRDLSLKDSNKGTKNSPTNNYKGITLKEYFRLCEDKSQNLRQIEEQSPSSSHSSMVETPSFNQPQNKKNNPRAKIKTQICQSVIEANQKNNLKLQFEKNQETIRSQQKIAKIHYLRDPNQFKKKQDRKKIYTKIHSQSTKYHLDILNRSTLTSFFQLQQSKNKMLKKIEADKKRVNDLRLSDAFFITKYGAKFKIQTNQIINDAQ